MDTSVTKLAILGSTGSIGQQTLDAIRALPDRFQVLALAAGNNLDLLAQQIDEFHPRYVSYQAEEDCFSHTGCIRCTMDEMAVNPDVDIVVIAASGKAGLSPTLAAVRAGKTIALSNKESLVTAGELIMREAKEHNAVILPVDSEHSALWQCLNGEAPPVRLVLTASGGPFRQYTWEEMQQVTVDDALNHPSWKMGKKVTIDSATLMNKGLEIIEAHWLFSVPYEAITVIIHPQSIIHSMVEFADGAVKAQLSSPDMRLPIQYALTWPERLANPVLPFLDWSKFGDLTFEQPDLDRFPCLRLAIEAGKTGGTAPAALCAADEEAVELFLAGKIKLTDIPRLVALALDRLPVIQQPDIETILQVDREARQVVQSIFAGEP